MDIYFSDIFDVDPDTLEEYGAFNISLINDLPLFIDPFLLFNSPDSKYQELHQGILKYLGFLRARAATNKISHALIKSWFMFPEVKQTWLGFSVVGNQGSGLGFDFALALANSLYSIFSGFGQESVTRSSHLEKLCLIKDNVGRDNISDFTTHLIKEYLLEYTQAFAREYLAPEHRAVVSVPKVRFNYGTWTWEPTRFELPYFNNDYVILTPKDILTKDDIWINKNDMVREYREIASAMPNEQLRAQLDNYLIRHMPDSPKAHERRAVIARMIREHPEFIDYYIAYKEDRGEDAISLSAQNVRQIESVFIDNVVDFVGLLESETPFYALRAITYNETRRRIVYLKDVIENKGGHRLFVVDGQPVRREKDVQILFRFVWFGTSLDVSREVDDGRGPVDYKISKGAKDKTLVEFKLASNSQLKRNLEKQVSIYQKASDARQAMEVIVYFTESELRKVETILRELGLENSPDIVLIDARADNKPPGSKA